MKKGLKQCAERFKMSCIKTVLNLTENLPGNLPVNLPRNLPKKQVVFINNLLYNMYSGLYI